MGNGSGPGQLNSRIYTNSFSNISNSLTFSLNTRGNSFGGLSKPQYSFLTYNTLAYHGAGAGGRGDRWNRRYSNGISFIPPN
jgi:hypothetical protein